VSLDWPKSPSALKGASSIVFYSRPAGEIVLSPEVRPQFEELMAAGAGFVAIHWATGIGYSKLADSEEIRNDYKNILGGWFRRPPGDVRIDRAKLVQVDADHPVCRGWSGYDIRDEFYLNLIFHEGVRPLLSVRVDGRDRIVGWAFERPSSNDGRSFGITLGHFHENFSNESFRRAIVNGILWTAHRDVPSAGASVTVDDRDLTLPPANSGR
jgi:type 1 glutamine amidotransferase